MSIFKRTETKKQVRGTIRVISASETQSVGGGCPGLVVRQPGGLPPPPVRA